MCDAALFCSYNESWLDSAWLRQKKPCSSRGHNSTLHLQLFDGRANNGLPTETDWSVWSPTQIAAFPSAARWINCLHNDGFTFIDIEFVWFNTYMALSFLKMQLVYSVTSAAVCPTDWIKSPEWRQCSIRWRGKPHVPNPLTWIMKSQSNWLTTLMLIGEFFILTS